MTNLVWCVSLSNAKTNAVIIDLNDHKFACRNFQVKSFPLYKLTTHEDDLIRGENVMRFWLFFCVLMRHHVLFCDYFYSNLIQIKSQIFLIKTFKLCEAKWIKWIRFQVILTHEWRRNLLSSPKFFICFCVPWFFIPKLFLSRRFFNFFFAS